MIFFLWSAFLLHFIVCAFSISDECNPMECFQAFDTLFQPSNMETSCEKITNLEECIKVCSRNETDHYFHQGLAEVREELCQNYRNHNRLENKCENKHKYSFAACIYDKFNYEAEDPNASQNVLLCKQTTAGDRCYETSLPLCSDRAGYLANKLLVNLFNPIRRINCINVKQEDFDLEVKSLPFIKDLQSLAECLDVNSPHLTLCVRKKWTDSNVMLDQENICSDTQYFFNCVQKVLQSKCNSAQRTFFKSIRHPVFAYLLPHCLDKQDVLDPESPHNSMDSDSYHEDALSDSESLDEANSDAATVETITSTYAKVSGVHGLDKNSDAATIGTISSTRANRVSGVHGLDKVDHDASTNTDKVSGIHGLNKVNYDASTNATISPTNTTEVRVLHQHVIITMTYKEKNAANQIYVCFYLFVLVFMLGLGKEL